MKPFSWSCFQIFIREGIGNYAGDSQPSAYQTPLSVFESARSLWTSSRSPRYVGHRCIADISLSVARSGRFLWCATSARPSSLQTDTRRMKPFNCNQAAGPGSSVRCEIDRRVAGNWRPPPLPKRVGYCPPPPPPLVFYFLPVIISSKFLWFLYSLTGSSLQMWLRHCRDSRAASLTEECMLVLTDKETCMIKAQSWIKLLIPIIVWWKIKIFCRRLWTDERCWIFFRFS